MSDNEESVVISPRDYSDIAKLQELGLLEQFLANPTTAAMEAITGAFACGGKGLIVSAGRIAQGLVKGQLYDVLADEWRRLREAGKLPDNLGETKHGLYTWAELMRIIDEECPDADRMEALKAAFYAVNKVDQTDANRIQAYQLWQITKQLTSGEIHLMRTLYVHANELNSNPPSGWLEPAMRLSGFQSGEMIEVQTDGLRKLRLVNAANPSLGQKSMLTNLGLQLCQNINTYQVATQKPK